MKVLSLRQPYAELVVSGHKTIEIRKWRTKYRGELYIHASQRPYGEAMEEFGFDELPTGRIIGKVRLIGVKEYDDDEAFLADRSCHLSRKEFGCFGFVFADPQRIEPIPAKGRLGIWEHKSF